MASAALLERIPRPTPADILEQLSCAPCRCTDPEVLIRAVQAAADHRARRLYRRAG
jgi:aerobic-type carbon monoxide dehydrogenase small subunit (CoxS/CutS family)